MVFTIFIYHHSGSIEGRGGVYRCLISKSVRVVFSLFFGVFCSFFYDCKLRPYLEKKCCRKLYVLWLVKNEIEYIKCLLILGLLDILIFYHSLNTVEFSCE